jgi:hypothetical protein
MFDGCDEFTRTLSNEHSTIGNLKYIGDFYAGQISDFVGGKTLGAAVKHFGSRDIRYILSGVHRCCRNQRIGAQCDNGYCVPTINKRAAMSLLRLLLYARQNPSMFPCYHAQITEPSAEFHKLIRAVEDM